MKFLSLILVAMLGVVACTPITKSHPKSKGNETDEEKASALQKVQIPGLILALSTEAEQIVARKQGKVRHRAMGLRADEHAESVRILENLDIQSIHLEDNGTSLTLTGNFKTQTPVRDRDIRVTLKPDPADSTRWIGRANYQIFVVTCLPQGSSDCMPTAASVIEIMSQVNLSNHKPRTFSFLYGETEASARLEGSAPTQLGRTAFGVLRSVAVLNADAPVPSTLSLRLLANKVLSFSAKYDPAAPGEMLWRIERAYTDDGLEDYEFNGETATITDSTRISLPLRRKYVLTAGTWTVTAGIARKLIGPAE